MADRPNANPSVRDIWQLDVQIDGSDRRYRTVRIYRFGSTVDVALDVVVLGRPHRETVRAATELCAFLNQHGVAPDHVGNGLRPTQEAARG